MSFSAILLTPFPLGTSKHGSLVWGLLKWLHVPYPSLFLLLPAHLEGCPLGQDAFMMTPGWLSSVGDLGLSVWSPHLKASVSHSGKLGC